MARHVVNGEINGISVNLVFFLAKHPIAVSRLFYYIRPTKFPIRIPARKTRIAKPTWRQ
jgi:hypothetical protein